MSQLWYLGNRKTNVTDNRLFLREIAKKVIHSIQHGESDNDILIWTEGWSAWKAYKEVPEIVHEIDKIRRESEVAQPPPMPKNTPPIPIHENKMEAKVPEKKASPTKRKHARVVARFKCIIKSSTITFRTFTKDISLGGVSLEDEIPSDLIGTECVLYISSTKTNKNLKFKVALTERCVAKYFSFHDADEQIISELGKWLDDHQRVAKAS